MGERRSASQSYSVCPLCRMVIDSKGPCTDHSRCLAAVPVIGPSGVIPADHIHERIDVHGGLGAIVDVIRMLAIIRVASRCRRGPAAQGVDLPRPDHALFALLAHWRSREVAE